METNCVFMYSLQKLHTLLLAIEVNSILLKLVKFLLVPFDLVFV